MFILCSGGAVFTGAGPESASQGCRLLLRRAYEAARPLITAGIEAGIIRSSHPALFFSLLNSAVNQPPGFPALLNRFAPEIDSAEARALLTQTLVATLLHPPTDTVAVPSLDPGAPSGSNLRPRVAHERHDRQPPSR